MYEDGNIKFSQFQPLLIMVNVYICCCSVAKLCSTLCNPWTAALQTPMSSTITTSTYLHVVGFNCVQLFATPWSLLGSSVHGIFQARILKWVISTYTPFLSPYLHIVHFSISISISLSVYPLPIFASCEYVAYYYA